MVSVPIARREFLAGAFATAVLSPALAKSEHAAPPNEATNKVAEKLFASKPAPALSFAAARGDGVAWAEAFGHADLELEVPATVAHSFPLGSVSKVVTSTAVAKLISKGKLDLDTPIVKWLPDLPEQHHKTTMRHLLTHRSGIRHYNSVEISLANPHGPIYMRIYPKPENVLALFIHDPLIAAPGTSVNYSSYGYTLASYVIQAAAERPFLDVIQEEIARAFDLPSLKADDPWAIVPSRASGYMNAADIQMLSTGLSADTQPQLTNGWAKSPFCNPAYSWSGAGFLMTPSDAAKFGVAMIDGRGSKLSAPERQLLFTPMTAASKESPALGLGWRISPDKKGRTRWHHAGATPGGCYFLAIYPEQGLAIALAGNVMSARINMNQAASDLVDTLV